MESVFVYANDCMDFSTSGLVGDLKPISCTFEEEKNGISQITMQLCFDALEKWKAVKSGCYIKCRVPVRVPPAVTADEYAAKVEKIRRKQTTVKMNVQKFGDDTEWKPMGSLEAALYLTAKAAKEKAAEFEKIKSTLKGVVTQIVNGSAKMTTEGGKTGWVDTAKYETVETVAIPQSLDGVEYAVDAVRLSYQLFFVTDVNTTLDGIEVTAKHVFYELLGAVTDYKGADKVTGAAACAGVLANLYSPDDRFTIASDCKDEQDGFDYRRMNAVQALLDPDDGICARYGLCLLRDNFDIYALKNVETDRGFAIEYGKNMLSLDKTENIDSTYTRIIPYGKDKKGNPIFLNGTKWVDSPHIGDYAAPRVMMLDCTDTAAISSKMTAAQVQDELKKRAQAELDGGIDLPDLSIEVDFLSLGDTEEYKQYRNLDKVYLLDNVALRDKVRGYSYKAQVVAIRHNVLTGQTESITLSSIKNHANARKIASWQVPTVDGKNIRLQTIETSNLADNFGTDLDLSQNDELLKKYERITGIYITDAGIDVTGAQYVRIGTAGKIVILSGNLQVDDQGNVSVTGIINAQAGGQIGGYTIGTDKLSSGNGASAVALSNADGDDAIWAGAEDFENAPFRVTRDGTVYMTKLMAVGADGTAKSINLRNYPFWDVWNKMIVSVSDDGTVTLRDGTTFSRARAVTLDGSWAGGTFTVEASNGKSTYATLYTATDRITWEGNTASIPIGAIMPTGYKPTGFSTKLDASRVADSVTVDSVTVSPETINIPSGSATKAQQITIGMTLSNGKTVYKTANIRANYGGSIDEN